jgi:hypothetical protein
MLIEGECWNYICYTYNTHSTYLWTDHILYIEGHLLNHVRLFLVTPGLLFLSLSPHAEVRITVITYILISLTIP